MYFTVLCTTNGDVLRGEVGRVLQSGHATRVRHWDVSFLTLATPVTNSLYWKLLQGLEGSVLV